MFPVPGGSLCALLWGLLVLHHLLSSCRAWRDRWVPAQATEGPKEGTCAEPEATVLQQNKDSPPENHPEAKTAEVSLTPWAE